MRSRSLAISFLLLLAGVVVMRWQGQSLVTPFTPKGIIDLELASSADRLRQIRLFWNERDVLINIYLDFLFIAAYTWFFRNAIRYTATKFTEGMNNLAVFVALLDIAENLLMVWSYTQPSAAGMISWARYAAVIKFTGVAVIMLYLLAAMPWRFFQKTNRA